MSYMYVVDETKEECHCECRSAEYRDSDGIIRVVTQESDNEESRATACFTTKNAQRKDPDIGPIMEWVELKPQQPSWASVSPSSVTTKVLCTIGYSSLRMIDGVLYRN